MMLGDRKNVLWMNGDDPDIQSLFSNMTSTRLNAIIGTNEVVVIDEAQRIEGIGLRIKTYHRPNSSRSSDSYWQQQF